jgi:hypothetical protein
MDNSRRQGLILFDSIPYDVPAALVACLPTEQAPQGRKLMHEHSPDKLVGPVRGSPAWWRGMVAEPEFPVDGTPTTVQPRDKRPKKDGKPIRMDLVNRVRQEIAAGTYETQEKWEAALDCLLDKLERDN